MVEYYQYAVKFISGKSGGKIVAPGRYWTAINVHNPINNPIELIMKFAVALPGKPGPISKYTKMKLGGMKLLRLIGNRLPNLFQKGSILSKDLLLLDVRLNWM